MVIRANLTGKGESWNLDPASKTPLTTFRPHENRVKVWGRQVPAEASGAHRVGAGGRGSRLLGGSWRQAQPRVAPAPARAPPPAPAPAGRASPRRAPRTGSWPSASRSAGALPGAEERKPPRRLAAFVSTATGAARGGRREWAGLTARRASWWAPASGLAAAASGHRWACMATRRVEGKRKTRIQEAGRTAELARPASLFIGRELIARPDVCSSLGPRELRLAM